jgi:MFS family permease
LPKLLYVRSICPLKLKSLLTSLYFCFTDWGFHSNMQVCRTRLYDLGISLPGKWSSATLSSSYSLVSQPEMIESFGVKKGDVAEWAGITSAVFSMSQCLTAVLWGRVSDKFGRKPTILIGLTCTLIFSLVWGMSTNLPMAILARAMSGAFNGNGTVYSQSFPFNSTDHIQLALFAQWLQKWSLKRNYNQEPLL